MRTSIYRKREIKKLKTAANALHEQGFSLREVAQMLDKSHEWVRKAVIERTGDIVDKSVDNS